MHCMWAERLGDVRGGHSRLTIFFKIWIRSNAIRRIQEPTSKCFFLTVLIHFRVWWSSECDDDEWLSVPEIELLVKLSIAFDFCSSCCFIFMTFYVGLFVCKNTLGFSIHTAQSLGKHKNFRWVLGRLNFHWVGENNPLGWVPLGLLQRGVFFIVIIITIT